MRISDWSSDVCSSDLTLRDAVYASGIARPRQASAAELQRLQDQAMAAAGQAAPPPQAMMPMAYPGTVAPGDMQAMPGATEPHSGPPAPPVRSDERSVGKGLLHPCRSRCAPDHAQEKIRER